MVQAPIALILVGQLGSTLAFSSLVGGPRSSATNLPTKTTRTQPPSPSSEVLGSSLFASPPTNEEDFSASGGSIQKRRTFLANFAASSLLPLLTVANPSSASAWGYATNDKGPLVYGADDIMSQKEHGTSAAPVQENLRYGVSGKLADKICSFNRVFAEMGGYWEGTSFEKDVRQLVASTGKPVTFYDSVSGKPLFEAPINRSVDEFIAESKVHGWPSFRDDEVVWDNVRVLKSSGETVSAVGTHLGHNIPDSSGNRYCINLVSMAGSPVN